MMSSWTGRFAVGVLLAAAFTAGAYLSGPGVVPLPPLPAAPAVELLLGQRFFGLDGQPASLSRWQGRPLVINFWASWCAPCVDEMPLLSAMQRRFPAVQFVGIAAESADSVQAFAAVHPVSYPLLADAEGVMRVMPQLGNTVRGLPFTVAIDALGRPRHVQLGAVTEAGLLRMLHDLVSP